MTLLDLITSGRRIERRSRKIRELADERDISLAAAADIFDGMAEETEDAAREARVMEAWDQKMQERTRGM